MENDNLVSDREARDYSGGYAEFLADNDATLVVDYMHYLHQQLHNAESSIKDTMNFDEFSREAFDEFVFKHQD